MSNNNDQSGMARNHDRDNYTTSSTSTSSQNATKMILSNPQNKDVTKSFFAAYMNNFLCDMKQLLLTSTINFDEFITLRKEYMGSLPNEIEYDTSILHAAILTNQLPIVIKIIDTFKITFFKSRHIYDEKNNLTALESAIQNNCEIIVEYLFDNCNIDLNELERLHLIRLTFQYNQYKPMRYLLLTMDKQLLLDNIGMILWGLSETGRCDIILELLQKFNTNNDIDLLEIDIDGGNLLHGAVKSSNIQLIDFYIQKGLDINQIDDHGYNPVTLAIKYHSWNVFKHVYYKTQNGKNDIKTDLITPLNEIVSDPNSTTDIIDFVINLGFRQFSKTLVLNAAKSGNFIIMKHLIDKYELPYAHKNPKSQNLYHLLLSIPKCTTEWIQYISSLPKKIDINIRDEYSNSPAYYALHHNIQTNVIRLLIRLGMEFHDLETLKEIFNTTDVNTIYDIIFPDGKLKLKVHERLKLFQTAIDKGYSNIGIRMIEIYGKELLGGAYDSDCLSVLYLAIRSRNPDFVEYLITKQKLPLTNTSKKFKMPIMEFALLVDNIQLDIIKLLIQHNVPIPDKSFILNWRPTIIGWCQPFEFVRCIDYFIQNYQWDFDYIDERLDTRMVVYSCQPTLMWHVASHFYSREMFSSIYRREILILIRTYLYRFKPNLNIMNCYNQSLLGRLCLLIRYPIEPRRYTEGTTPAHIDMAINCMHLILLFGNINLQHTDRNGKNFLTLYHETSAFFMQQNPTLPNPFIAHLPKLRQYIHHQQINYKDVPIQIVPTTYKDVIGPKQPDKTK